jgi:hypothetical protein
MVLRPPAERIFVSSILTPCFIPFAHLGVLNFRTYHIPVLLKLNFSGPYYGKN